MDGVVGHLLRVVGAAEKLVGLSVARLSCEDLAEGGGRFIDASLLEKDVGLRCVGQERANTEEEEEREGKGKTQPSRRCCGEHS
jgi:hypothetical protein